MSTPRIAIVVRTRNRPVFLARSLGSIAAQTFGDWVVAVVDQGDPEVSGKIIAQFPDDFQARVRHVPVGPEAHLGALINVGIRSTESDYVVCLDDDDTWAPEYLEKMERALREKPNAAYGAVACHAISVFEERDEAGAWVTREKIPKPTFRNVSIRSLMRKPMLQPHAVMWERRIHETVGYFNEEVYGSEDWDFHLRLVCKFEIAVLEEPLALYHRRPPEARPVDFTANSTSYLRAFTKYDITEKFDARVREYLEEDPTRTALLQYLGQMERAIEKQLDEIRGDLAGMDRRMKAASDKIGKIDSRTQEIKEATRKKK